ncbi:hypothetical protein D3C87_1937440 [compost metagenome]
MWADRDLAYCSASFRTLLFPNRPDLPRSSPNRSGCSAMAFAMILPLPSFSVIAVRSLAATSTGSRNTRRARDSTVSNL